MIKRKSDGGYMQVHNTASVVIVTAFDATGRVIDSYQLTPRESVEFRDHLTAAEAGVRRKIDERREQDRRDGLTQLDFIDRAIETE